MANLDAFLTTRLSQEVLTDFKEKCDKANRKYTDVNRELIVAFNEGRIKIQPTEEQKKQMEMYND